MRAATWLHGSAPRGFGENPVDYHLSDLPPSHHYLAAYRWPGYRFPRTVFKYAVAPRTATWNGCRKTLSMSASCGPDAALGDSPLIYPFLVNDPGEGTEASGAAHAVLVDHLILRMAQGAETI